MMKNSFWGGGAHTCHTDVLINASTPGTRGLGPPPRRCLRAVSHLPLRPLLSCVADVKIRRRRKRKSSEHFSRRGGTKKKRKKRDRKQIQDCVSRRQLKSQPNSSSQTPGGSSRRPDRFPVAARYVRSSLHQSASWPKKKRRRNTSVSRRTPPLLGGCLELVAILPFVAHGVGTQARFCEQACCCGSYS